MLCAVRSRLEVKLRAPSKVRRRVLFFVGVLAVAIGVLQWSGLPTVLDNLLGLEWSKSVVAFLKANTQGLIIIAILTLFFEFIGFDRSREAEREEAAQIQELLNDAVSSSTGAALARMGLRREYGDKAGQQLSSIINQNSQILKDLVVRISIGTREEDVVVARTRLSYHCNTERFTVAFVTEPLAIPVLNTAMPHLNEILVVTPSQLAAKPGEPGAAISVSVIAKHASRDWRASLKFTELSDKKLAAALKKGGAAAPDFGCKLFEAHPARDLGINQKGITDLRFTIDYEVEVDTDFPYTFWTADRPLHIREIEVDMRGLPQAQRAGAKVQLHLGSVPWTNVPTSATGVWHFPVDCWAVNGQGIFVLWRKA